MGQSHGNEMKGVIRQEERQTSRVLEGELEAGLGGSVGELQDLGGIGLIGDNNSGRHPTKKQMQEK